MEGRKILATFTICISLAVILVFALGTGHPNYPSLNEIIGKKLYRDDFEGYEKGETNLVTIHLLNLTNSEGVLRLVKYKGKWKSELDYTLYANFREFKDRFIDFSSISEEVKSDSELFKNVKIIRLRFEINEKLNKLNGSIEVDGKSFLDFESKSVVRNDVYNAKLCYGLAISLLSFLSIGIMINHYTVCLRDMAFAGQTSVKMLNLMLLYEFTFISWQIHNAYSDLVDTGVEFILMAAIWGVGNFICILMLSSTVYALNANSQAMSFQSDSSDVKDIHLCITCLLSVIFALIILLSKFYFITVPLLHLFFVPQIIMNAKNGYNKSVSLVTITIILLTKGLVSAYFLVYEDNFIKYKPDYLMFGTITCFLGIQGLVLYLQRSHPRFLVPRKYRPMNYDYYRSKEEEAKLKGSDNTCGICMTPLNIGICMEQVVNSSQTLHTPCDHKFHQNCLLNWFEVKMECPACKAILPPFEG